MQAMPRVMKGGMAVAETVVMMVAVMIPWPSGTAGWGPAVTSVEQNYLPQLQD
jgi:hypothetical protein